MKMMLRMIVIGLLLATMQGRLSAATRTWDGGGVDNKWSTQGNWDNNWSSGNNVVFGSGFASGTTIDLNGDRAVGNLSITATTSFTIANSTLTLSSGDLTRQSTAAGTHLITSAVVLGNTAAWAIDGSGSLEVSGAISDAGANRTFAKSGAGTLILSGNNSWGGATTISAGTLIAASNNALGTAAAGTSINSGATLGFQGGISYSTAEAVTSVQGAGAGGVGAIYNVSGNNSFAGTVAMANATSFGSASGTLTFNGIISGSYAFTKVGSGTIALANSANTFTGNINLNAGTLSVSADSHLGNAANDLMFGGGTLNTSGTFTLGSGRVINLTGAAGTIDVDLGRTLTLGTASQISGANSLAKSGSGTLLISGDNSASFTGPTIINGGTIQISAESNLGAAANDLTLNSGTLAVTSGFTANPGKVVTIGASGGTLDISPGQVLTLGAASQLAGTSTTLTKQGAGALVLSGDNSATFTGNFTINAGTVQVGAESNLGAAANDVTLNGGALSVTGEFTANSGKVFTIAGGGGTLDISPSQTLTLAGAGQLSGSGNLTKAGSGTLALSGDNSATFTGNTIINSGTVRIGAENNLGAAGNDLTFNSGILNVTTGFTTDPGKVFTFGAGGGTLDINSGQNLTLGSASQLTGSGILTKAGAGKLTVGGSSGYTGNLVLNSGEIRVEGNQSAVDAFLSASRLQGLSGSGGILTLAYNDATAKDRVISSQPTVPSAIKLGFDSVTRADHSYGLGATANDLQNYAGLVISGGKVYIQVDQTFTGNGSPTTLDVNGGALELLGGAGPSTLTFSGKLTLSGGTISGGGFGGGKGTLATSGDVEMRSGVTITGLPNLTMQPESGVTSRYYGTGAGATFYNFVKDGPGTVQLETAFNASSLLDVRAGTLLLGAPNLIGDSTPMRLQGGTFGTGGLNETLNTLTLTATSYIDLGASGSSILHFADSSGLGWTGGSSLVVYNWSGNLVGDGSGADQLYFGNAASGLTADQLSQVWFVDPAGFSPGSYPAELTASGELRPKPVPEPGTIVAVCLLFGALGYRERDLIRRTFLRRRKSPN